MPLFEYKAIAGNGRQIKGVIDADSLSIAKERLRKDRVLITAIALLDLRNRELGLTKTQLLQFSREMAQLLKAGLPLYESLWTLEEKQRNAKVQPLLADLCDRLKGGSSLSVALHSYPQTFDETYVSMIRSAEQSGSLAQAFDQLANVISRQQKLQKQLLSSLAYPALLGGFCLLVMGALFFFVIPSMKELFEGRELHPLTACILSISAYLNRYWVGLVLLGISSICILITVLRLKSLRRTWERCVLKIPYLKKILLESSLVRLFKLMEMLLSAGVPLTDTLKFSRKIVPSILLDDLLRKTGIAVLEGRKMSELFAQDPLMPSLVIRMLAIGEETGKMGKMMGNLADIYQEDLDKDLLQLATFLQPALLIFLGFVVGIVVLSILLPLTDVSSFTAS